MFQKWNKYSYADKRDYIVRMRLFALKIIMIVLAYIIFTNVFFSMIKIESSSMRPSLQEGERFIFSALDFSALLIKKSPYNSLNYEHGDIVMVNRMHDEENIFLRFFDKLLHFLSVGKISLIQKKDRLFVKRIIGLPGDEISMVSFVMQVRPVGDPYTFTEYELSGKRFYQLYIPPASSDDTVPFTGNMNKFTLAEGECYVLSDDRSNTNDSRTWGPVPMRHIKGKAIFRYWPLSMIGTPYR